MPPSGAHDIENSTRRVKFQLYLLNESIAAINQGSRREDPTHESDTEGTGEFECGGRRYAPRDEDRNARMDGLCHHICGDAAARDDGGLAQVDAVEEGPSDHLVDGVVATDILAQDDGAVADRSREGGLRSGGLREGRAVHAPRDTVHRGSGKHFLRTLGEVCDAEEPFAAIGDIGRGDEAEDLAGNGPRTAGGGDDRDAAGRQGRRINSCDIDSAAVVADENRAQRVAAGEEPASDQMPDGQIVEGEGRAKQDHEVASVHPDEYRRLESQWKRRRKHLGSLVVGATVVKERGTLCYTGTMSTSRHHGPDIDRAHVDRAVETILALCAIPSPTGFVDGAVEYVSARLAELGFTPERRAKGTILCELGGTGRPLVLASHVDTLGAMVRSVKSNGRLRYTKIGGYPDLYLVGETCMVYLGDGRKLTGTFQPIEPAAHVNTKLKELAPTEETMELVLDEAVSSADATRKLGVRAGDFVSIDARPKLTDSGYIKSRHLDDKASSGVLLALAAMVARGELVPNRRLVLLFSVWEEVGHGGSVLPAGIEEFIAVDMGAVGDDLGCSDRMVSICAKDSNGPYDRSVVLGLEAAAKKAGCDFAVDIYPSYGSDAEAALRAGYDLRHGCMGPGVSASHGYERTHRDAVANTLALLVAYVGN